MGARKKKWFCGSCQKNLGKGSKICPTVWCHICGWVHFKCAGIKTISEHNDNFICTNCSKKRILIENDDSYEAAFNKIHDSYTNTQKATAFGSRQNLIKATKCSPKQVDKYLHASETYTKFKMAKKRFIRLKVISYRLNEIWSIDLADMQQLARDNSGIKYLFVAVDTLSRFLWASGMKSKTSKECADVLKKIIASNSRRTGPKICTKTFSPEKLWADKGREFEGEFATFCREKGIEIYSTQSETKSAMAERYIRTLKSLIFKYLHEHDTNRYIDQLDNFASIINSRVNRITKLAPRTVSQKDVPYLVSLCNTNLPQRPKFKIGDQVRVRRKIETFHRGYKIQFTEELFTIVQIPTNNPPTYVVKDTKNEIILGKFYEPELVKFTPLHHKNGN